MTRAVLDTNVLASGAVASPGTTLARIIDAMGQGSFELVVSEVILIELRRTLANPYYAGRSHSYSADQPAARPLPSWLVRRVRVTTPCVVRICQGPAQLDE